MSSSASCTDSGHPKSPHATGRLSSRFERLVARVLVAAMIGMSPSSAFAGEEFSSADDAVMQTPGSIDNSIAGETTIDSLADQGLTNWAGGLDQPAGNTLYINQPGADSTHTNTVGGGFTAHLDGTLISNGNVVIASPFGVFIGNEAVLDVGSLVAVGGRLPLDDFSSQPTLDLTAPVENRGLIRADRNVLFYGTRVRNEGQISLGTGELLMLGGDSVHFIDPESVTEALLNPTDFVAILGSGSVENHGQINAPAAALMGRHVANHGEIAIADGSLMMLGADAVYVSQFDNPVLVRLPHNTSSTPSQGEETNADDPAYAVENHGTIDAGLGHVRLAASDPLGWGIRQGAGNGDRRPSIAAQRIEIDGGEGSRVAISGDIDASAGSVGDASGVGGEIDITGTVITLNDAHVDASGDGGGGVVHIGGEQQGRGELQRARILTVDAESAVRADALESGDGGRVILFSEDLTSIGGQLSARGGEQGGDGGFIETSGLRHFRITQTPDAAAPAGDAGEWLIDPYSIRIRADSDVTGGGDDDDGPLSCDPSEGEACLNAAVESVLSPNFDGAAFDDILRTVTQDPLDVGNDASLNDLSVDLLIRALAVGTDITLSTEAFNPLAGDEAEGPGGPNSNGDITIDAPIAIGNGETLEGTRARLTLLAAGSIYVNQDITIGDGGATTTSDMSLSLEFRANDQSQRPATDAFGTDMLRGRVVLGEGPDANGVSIQTGGGDFVASGISFEMANSGSVIETAGGDVSINTGSLNASYERTRYVRDPTDPNADPSNETPPVVSYDPRIAIAGAIDTSTPDDDPETGGNITLASDAILVVTNRSGDDLFQIDTGGLDLTGRLSSGGGDITMTAGTRGSNSAGSLSIDGAMIDSATSADGQTGGNISIDANRVDPEGLESKYDVQFFDEEVRGQGGEIEIVDGQITTNGGTLAIGSTSTQAISIDGDFDTTHPIDPMAPEQGLMTIVAGDESGIGTTTDPYGKSLIQIGARDGATTLLSAGISIAAREVVTSSPTGGPVSITARGTTTASILESTLGIDSDPDSQSNPSFANEGEIVINGDRNILLNANTSITAESIRITAAADPAEIDDEAETDYLGMPFDDVLTRLVFEGSGGNVDSTGVRLSANEIAIAIGDGTTATEGLVYEDPGTTEDPTEFGLERGSRGMYSGLQLRGLLDSDPSDPGEPDPTKRPDIVSIQQDGDLTLAEGMTTEPGVLDLGADGAFGSSEIGADGQRMTFESSDGVLSINSVAGLNNNPAPGGGDDGLSWVTLNGGLLLHDINENDPMDSIVFSPTLPADSIVLEGLTLSTPRNLTIDSIMAGVIGSVAELVFQAGRDTDVDDAAGDGTLTVADGVVLQSSDRLALLAGASGFGDLVFEENGAFTLAANDIELRAGAGPDSLNDDQDDRSRILAFQSERNTLIDIRRAEMMADFVSTPGIELSFEFRQDEGIDSDPDLPDFDRFSSAPGIDSFGTAGPLVEYRVRSDKGSIDFRGDATGGDRFTQAALSLIGRQSDDDPAIRVDDTFAFEGTQLELGSGTDFTYTQRLADAFNPTDDPSAVRDRITLRAGVNGSGTLRFEGEDEDSVAVTARQIDLVASAGANGQGESRIQVDNGEFDLSGGTFGPRTLVYQVDGDIDVDDLPSQGQFTGGLPNILAIRADDGRLRLEDFDITSLPLFLDDVPGSDIGARLILEGDIVSLSEDDGGDLVLTPDLPADPNDPLRNLRLRLRANTLQLEASTSDVDSGDGRVLLGGRNEETPPVEGTDTDYSTQTLLIEGFDASTEIATTENLSALSEVEDDPGIYNLEDGRGPTSIVIDQDGAVTPDELPLRFAIAGYLERSTASDENDEPIATSYGISSLQSTVTLTPDNVSGSDLRIGGSNAPIKGDISFDIGDSSLYLDETGGLYPGASNLYAFENVAAYSGDSIIVSSGVTMSATDTILLAAAVPLTPFQPTEPIQQMGNLVFGDQDPSDDTDVVRNIILRANQILLTAGSNGTITNPDEDGDGQRDPIPQSALAQIDFRGLQSIEREGDFGTSLLAVRQSRNFNLGSEDELPTNVGRGDIVTPLTFNAPAAPEDEWNTLDLSSIQGRLTVTRIGEISEFTQSLTLGRTRPDASVVVETLLTDPFADRDGLGGFEGQVRLEANDVTFQFPSTAPDDAEFTLNTPRLQLVSDTIVSGTEAFDSEGRLRSDLFESGAPLRPIVRVKQPGDFASTFLPRPDRYFRIPLTIERDSTEQLRGSLEEIDIELTTTGSELTLGDDVREGASFSNLILQTLDPTANITIDFDSLTPGYDTYDFAANDIDSFDYAALQLTSLDMHANRSIQEGTITVAPFSPDVVDGMLSDMPADLTITTAGDQRFGGDVALQETLSTNGRDIRFTGDVYRDGSSGLARDDAGLIVESRHEVFFEENIGVHDNLAQLDSALGKLWLLFDSDARFGTPSVQFGKRIDLDGDGIAETPVNSNQTVLVNGDIVFATLALDDPNNPQDEDDGNLVDDFRNDIEMARTLGNIANALARYDVGRIDTAPYATIGKSRGDLTFRTLGQYSHFIMASGERLSVGGDLEINQIDAPDAVVTLGDVGALDIEVVNANQIGLVRRNAGVTLLPDGSSSQDAGPVILANTLDFGGTPLEVIGRGKTTRFGVENPYDPTLPSELNAFGVFANTNDGGLLSPGSFAFDPSLLEYVDVVASLLPAGASRSELAGANGPFFLPTPTPAIRDTPPLEHPERMMELDVEALPLPTDATLARLEGAAVIDDLGRMSDDYTARVSDVRLDEQDSELAVALHGKLFGPDGDRAGEVREILQDALDRYLETTRARRVIGFELRRFVKNRPSSLLEAYTTLDELDSLFRYHRRLGLSPGEYRRIQHVWLQDIQPDGITLDELSEAIHPSRYVRGSDILDIFGR